MSPVGTTVVLETNRRDGTDADRLRHFLSNAGLTVADRVEPACVGVPAVLMVAGDEPTELGRRLLRLRQVGHHAVAAFGPLPVPDARALAQPDACFGDHEPERLVQWLRERLAAQAPRSVTAGRYSLLHQVGRGSMGTVWSALDRETGELVAVKRLHRCDAEAFADLQHEFRVAADLSHPNLVQVHELVAYDRDRLLTMELVAGVALTHYIAAAELDESALTDLFAGVAQGLCALHGAGLLHLDVKPTNVMVRANAVPVLLDFGVARLAAHEREGAKLIGTLPYMAPEILAGSAPSPASDWYSFGATLYEVLAGRPAFPGPAHEVSRAKLERRPVPPLHDVPFAALASLAHALLHDDPNRRPRGPDVLHALGASPPVQWPTQRSRFIGRTSELAILDDALSQACNGSVSVCRVHGPPGIGKTACVRTFLETRAVDALVLEGRCYERESVPFKGFDSILTSLCDQLDEQPVAASVADDVARVRHLTGQLDHPEPGEPSLLRMRSFRAVGHLLERLANGRPIVLFVDDAQWADEDGARLLATLLGPGGPSELLFIAAYRDGEDSAMTTELDEASGIASYDVALLPLPKNECMRLVRSLLRDVPTEDAATIADEAAGSPLLVEVIASTSAAHTHGRATLESALALAVDSLGGEARNVLELVSFAGRPVSRKLVEVAMDLPAGEAITHVGRLRNLRLLRTTGARPDAAIAPHHDRIREIVVQTTPPTVQANRHLALAQALERDEHARPEHLAEHWHMAGNDVVATRHAETAAEQARTTLAFSSAARLYEQAAAWEPDDDRRRTRLLRRHAESLVLAGRGAAAAPVFARLAEHAPKTESRVLRRVAAEQYMTTGHQEQGVTLLRPLLLEEGLTWPRGGLEALTRTIAHLIRLRITGVTPARTVRPAEVRRGNLCWSAARGLLATDSTRGAFYVVEQLVRATRGGDEMQLARAAAIVGTVILAPAGGRFAAWGERLAAQVRRTGERLGSAYLLGLSDVCEGNRCILVGRWRDALELCERGRAKLESITDDITWERNLGHMGAIRALEELGQLGAARQRSETLLEEAVSSGDRYGQVTALLYVGQAHLAAGNLERAADSAQRAAAMWSAPTYTMQDLYTIRLRVLCALLEGRPHDAFDLVQGSWPGLSKSGLMRLPPIHLDAHRMLVQAAAACGATDLATRSTRELINAPLPHARAHGLLLESGLGSDDRERLARARDAEDAFEALEMPVAAACARWHRAELLDDPTLRQQAESELRRCGVIQPARWAQLQAPRPR